MLRQFNKDQLLNWANTELEKGVKTNKAGFHRGFVSYSYDKLPSCACVILRSYDFDKRLLSFHTDVRSNKVAAIRKSPEVCFLVYDQGISLQVRFFARAHVVHGVERNQMKWDTMLDMSKRCYASEYGPGQKMAHSSHHMIGSDISPPDQKGFENFAIVECHFYAMDVLYLSHKGHLRCVYEMNGDEYSATWIAP